MNKAPKGGAFLLGFLISLVSFADGCLGTVSEAACPPPSQFHQGWNANASIYYQSTGFTSQESDQIGGGGALGSWNFHNSVPPVLNCSNVSFLAAPPAGQYTVTAANDQDAETPSACATTAYNAMSFGKLVAATTTFHWAAIRSNGSPSWNRDPNSSDYYTFIRKVMLHEAGHTMGLGEIPDSQQVAGQSVMNKYSGTNDSANNQPTDVQPCDDSSVNSILQYANNCGIDRRGRVV